MAKKISLELEIGGVKKSVSNINELEQAISEANKELKGLAFGSEEFNKLSTQIKKAKNTAEDLNESLKGQDLEKRVGAYAKVGSAIVSSFAAANATIALFGQESEAVAQAAAKAQAVLTIALTAREVAEGAVAVRTVAANIATVASAAAANSANVATRALYATIAANPYGALLVAVGAVAGALYAFGSSTEEVKDVTEGLNSVMTEEVVILNSQFIKLQSLNTSNEERARIIKDLNKTYPGFNALLDEENNLTQDAITWKDLYVKKLIEEAQAKLIINKIASKSNELLELQNKDVLKSIGLWDRFVNSLKAVGNVNYKTAELEALLNQADEANTLKTEIEDLTKMLGTLNTTNSETENQLEPLTKRMKAYTDATEAGRKAKEKELDRQRELNEAYKQGRFSTINLSDAVKQLEASLKKYETTLTKLGDINYEAPILKRLEKISQARQQASAELVTDVQKVQKSIKELAPNEAAFDPLIELFKAFRGNLEKTFGGLDTKGVEETLKGFQNIYEVFVKDNSILTQEQKGYLSDIITAYKDFTTLITDKNLFTPFISSLKNINVAWDDFRATVTEGGDPLYSGAEALVQIIGEITAANKNFVVEVRKSAPGLAGVAEQIQNSVEQILDIQFDPQAVKNNADQYIKKLEQDLFKPVAIRLLQLELEAQQAALGFAADDKTKATIKGLIDNITLQIETVTKTGQFAAQLSKTTGAEVQGEVNKLVEMFLKLSNGIVLAEQKFLLVNKQIDKFKKELNPEELSRAIGGVVLQNIDGISRLFLGATTEEEKLIETLTQKYKNSEEERFNFKKMLIEKGIDVEKASYEDLLKAYVAYKKKEGEVTKTSEKKKQDDLTTTLQEVGKYIQAFSQGLNEAASLAAQSITNQLDFLQMSYEAQLAQVVGDTETANNKRIELQKEYEAQRKEIEKQGRLTSLRFSLAQAVANAATAITNIWATQGINPILAGIQTAIVAGITTAELAIINEQIGMAQMMRRGGLVKAQGGMLLSGPTHEQGGIPLAQMGVIAEGQEAIINRNSLINYRDLLSSVNQAGGGRPLVMNNFDDTRIVEAIASQRQKPLRAYVLESEITNEQALAKRLDSLSKI